jgi:hypothetical protein
VYNVIDPIDLNENKNKTICKVKVSKIKRKGRKGRKG